MLLYFNFRTWIQPIYVHSYSEMSVRTFYGRLPTLQLGKFSGFPSSPASLDFVLSAPPSYLSQLFLIIIIIKLILLKIRMRTIKF
jgi:hypothetical protein